MAPRRRGAVRRRRFFGKQRFFEKKRAKNFRFLRALAPPLPQPAGAKVFWLLYFKKVTAFFPPVLDVPNPKSR
jgi:hypothetical protein